MLRVTWQMDQGVIPETPYLVKARFQRRFLFPKQLLWPINTSPDLSQIILLGRTAVRPRVQKHCPWMGRQLAGKPSPREGAACAPRVARVCAAITEYQDSRLGRWTGGVDTRAKLVLFTLRNMDVLMNVNSPLVDGLFFLFSRTILRIRSFCLLVREGWFTWVIIRQFSISLPFVSVH